MTAELLKGLQYKYGVNPATNGLASFLGGITEEEMWKDVTTETWFDGVSFRLKPIVAYRAVSSTSIGKLETVCEGDKDKVMAFTASQLEAGNKILVETVKQFPSQTVAEFLQVRNIQWRSDRKGVWKNGNFPDLTSILYYPVEFRARPDYAYDLTSRNEATVAELDFDDPKVLADHVHRLITENSVSSIEITRRPYC